MRDLKSRNQQIVEMCRSGASQREVARLHTGATFSVSQPTQSGRVYALEFKESLADSSWMALPLVAGNGGLLRLTDSSATSAQRFYRVRQW